MEKVIVLKDNIYAASSAGGTVDVLANANNLVDGGIAFYKEDGTLLSDIPANYVDCKEFTIAQNTGGTVRISKGFKRAGISRLTQGVYEAPVFGRIVIGGTTVATRLSIEDSDVGHVGINISDRGFSQQYATNSVNVSVYKRASKTVETVVDELVEKLNAASNIRLVAAKVGTAGNFGITVTSTTRGQVLQVSTDGLIELNQIITDGTSASVLAVNGTGVGEDVLELEREATVFYGNSFSRERQQEYFDQNQLGADASVNYDNIIFQEDLTNPYAHETNVKPLVMIFFPTTGTAANKQAILDVLGFLIGGVHQAATIAEPGND